MVEILKLRSRVKTIQSRIDAISIGRIDALEYWFEQLDEAKRELLMKGKLWVVIDEN
jgi:cell division inhibitor SulA